MLSRYSLSPHKEGYQFTTDAGISYTAYFSEYFLATAAGEEIVVYSFGFECSQDSRNEYDEKISLTADGMARHRRITFGKWYKEINSNIERYDCSAHHAKEGYYTSILVRSDNPQKEAVVEAFYYNLDTFFPPVD